MWCCMYPSFFRFKRLVEQDQCEIENNNDKTTYLIKEANELLKIIRSISINAKKNLNI